MRNVLSNHARPVWAEVSATRLKENLHATEAAARLQLGENGSVLAVIKADAYGHGACECAPVLAAAGANWLGVTCVEEGVAVRHALGILPQSVAPRILVMCGLWPGEAEELLRHQLTPVVWEPYHLDLLEAEAKRHGLPPRSLAVHIEIDTGMARQGVPSGEVLSALLQRFSSASPLFLEGVMTHLASAEDVSAESNREQMQRFDHAMLQVTNTGLRPLWVHAGNTSSLDGGRSLQTLQAIAASTHAQTQSMTRSGLALYGYALALEPRGTHPVLVPQIRPVLAWKTRIVSLRAIAAGDAIGYSSVYVAPHPMRLALLPVGYADGLRRELSSTNARAGGAVLIRGQRAPILGRISMDLTIVDATAIPHAEIGDEAVLIGEQSGAVISAEEHARLADTIVYEILCGISDRVPRVVVE